MQQTTTEANTYGLRVNELFDYPNTEPLVLLDACPQSTNLINVKSAYTTGDHFVFERAIGPELYMSNALKFRFDIPIEVTLKEPAKDASDAAINITEENFMEKVFNNCNDICISQYGFLQALRSCKVSLNGKDFTTTSHIAEAMNMLSQFYNQDDVAEWFPASQPDMFQSFDQYDGNSKLLKYIDEDGDRAQTCVSPEQDNNIFACKYTRGYMSRTPTFKWAGAGTDPQKQCRVRCIFSCYLPLSIGSVPGKITTLIGVDRIGVDMHTKPEMLGYLFNTKGTIMDTINTMKIDQSSGSQCYGTMILNTWNRTNGLSLPKDSSGNLAPYSIAIPEINTTIGHVDNRVAPGDVRSFNHAGLRCSSIPKAIYIGMARLKTGDFKTLTQTPINYGLLKSIEVDIDGSKTIYNSTADLSYVADTNGYDAFTDPLGRLTKGFIAKLDLTKDIGVPGTGIVGLHTPMILNISGTYVNQGASEANYQLQIVTALDGSLDYRDGQFSMSVGVVIDPQKLLNSEFVRQLQYNYGRRIDVVGAGLWNSLKNGVSSAAKFAWANRHKIARAIGDGVEIARTLKGGGDRQYSNTSGAGNTDFLGGSGVSTTQFWPQGAGAPRSPDYFKRR